MTRERTIGERIASAALVVLIHAGLLWMLLHAGGAETRAPEGKALATFDVAPPPPPPAAVPTRSVAQGPSGAAGRRAVRSAIVAPVPVLPPLVVPPVVAAVLPDLGAAASGGAAGGWDRARGRRFRERCGRHAGAVAVGHDPRRRLSTRGAAARIGGVVVARFTVGVDGRARDCRVTASAGHASLDATTCRLIEARFRYAPALDARDGGGGGAGVATDMVGGAVSDGRAEVVAVARDATHRFSKHPADRIEIVAGVGVVADAHAGTTVKHRSRVAIDPTQPNLRQVHLIHRELFDELAAKGFAVGPADLGENVTTRGVDLLALPTGAVLRIGADAVLEVTGLRNPCAQIERFRPGLLAAVLDRGADGAVIRKAGVMAVVRCGGVIRAGDAIAVDLPPLPHRPLERV
ncbi:MOSC domain-containing protein [Sphingomonas sp. MMS24-JH45]